MVGRMVPAVHVRRRVARRRPAIADGAEGTDLRADGWHRRGAHDFAAGTDWRRAELGLSLLLAARCDLHVVLAAVVRLHLRGCIVAYLAAARRGRRSVRPSDDVWTARGAPAHRARAPLAARI